MKKVSNRRCFRGKPAVTSHILHEVVYNIAQQKSHYITSHHNTSHHITSHHITSHHITSHHNTSHHITSHHTTKITFHHITSCPYRSRVNIRDSIVSSQATKGHTRERHTHHCHRLVARYVLLWWSHV